MGVTFWIAHATAIANDVGATLVRFIAGLEMGAKRTDDEVEFALIQFVAARRHPGLGLRASGSENRSCRSMQDFLGMVAVENLNCTGKQFLGRVPNPQRTIPQHHGSGGLREASPRRFAQRAGGEVGGLGIGVPSGGTLDRGRVGDGSRISHGLALFVPRFGTPHGDEFGLPGLGRTIGLLPARPATSAVRMGTPVPSMPKYIVGATSPILSTFVRSSTAISAPSASAARWT